MFNHFKKAAYAVLPDDVIDWAKVFYRYRKTYGVFPNLRHPKTFNEKIARRQLRDHRAILQQLSDKAAARRYVEEKLGPGPLTTLYCLTDEPEKIPFDELPQRFVVKPNHGSGWIHIVRDKSALDRAALIETCRGWLKKNYYRVSRERVYKHITPQIIVEEFIDDHNDSSFAPMDYKFFVFDSVVKYIQVHAGRYIDHRNSFYTPDWQKTDILLQYEGIEAMLPRPPHLEQMIAAAETLGRGIDFIRVDLYDTPQRFYFGEFTTNPGCGAERFNKPDYDVMFGGLWGQRIP